MEGPFHSRRSAAESADLVAELRADEVAITKPLDALGIALLDLL
jgi:hypothetical protein